MLLSLSNGKYGFKASVMNCSLDIMKCSAEILFHRPHLLDQGLLSLPAGRPGGQEKFQLYSVTRSCSTTLFLLQYRPAHFVRTNCSAKTSKK